MKFKHQKSFKLSIRKLIVLISAFSLILSTISFAIVSADEYQPGYTIVENHGVDNYQVTKAVPAIPMYAETTLDKYYLEFEFEDNEFVEGAEVSIELAEEVSSEEIVITNGSIIDAKQKGIYKANVSYAESVMPVYIVVRGADESAWYIYDEDFTQTDYNAESYTDIEIPNGWKSQYAQSTTSRTLGDFTHVGMYPANSDITSGIVPFYDTYLLTDGSRNITAQKGGVFTLNDPVVKDFRDYTISMESMIYNHFPNTSYVGVGLFGRAPVNADGKIYNSTAKDRFTIFAVNNAYRNNGAAGAYSGSMWRMTVGDGFYKQNSVAMGKTTDVNKALNNTGEAVSVPMSLKYDGSDATYTVAGTSYTVDLDTVNDDTPLDKGAVGVAGYNIGDGKSALDITLGIQRFSVALNNGDNDCPAYYREYPAAYQPTANQGVLNYKVSKAVPAIPMYVETSVDKYYLDFEMEDGVYTEGADVTIELDGAVLDSEFELLNDGTLLKAKKKGIYKANIISGTKIMPIYIIVRGINDRAWYIYDEDFTQADYNATTYSDIEIPAGWKSQYAQHMSSTTLGDFTHVGKYPNNSDILSGIVPFYDTYLLTDGSVSNIPSQQAAIFTLSNDVVGDFRDYTISMESMIYNHWPEYTYSGVGLFGRAPVNADGKIENVSGSKDRFTFFAVNNAFTNSGGSGTYSGDMWRMTLGDGFYNQNAAVLGKAPNVNKSLNNTGKAVSVPMSLKYEGSSATYTAAGTSYTVDLNEVNDDTPLDKGAVGVAGHRVADGAKYLDISLGIQRFSVALNNGDNECPAYLIDTKSDDEEDEEEVVVDASYEWIEGQGSKGYYAVTKAAPAIPMVKGATVDKAYLKFEFNDEYVLGNDTTITLADPNETGIIIEGDLITAQKKGNYLVKVSDGENVRDVYVVVRGAKDTKWYLYNHDFTRENYNPTAYVGEGSIPIPTSWAAQYTDGFSSKTLKDFTNVGMYPSDGVISTGIIPLYDTFHIGDGLNRSGVFTLNDPVVNAFSDYTISMDSMVYNHWPDYANHGIGLFGRAQLNEEGKIANLETNDRFTAFAVNNGYKNDGSAGAKSGDVFMFTLGDGFTSFKNETLGKAEVNKALNNSNDPVPVSMSLKLADNVATYTAGKTSFRYDLSLANNPNGYNDAGAVGVFGYGISDNSKYYDVWTAINTFSVALNNGVNSCPAYIVEPVRGIYDAVQGQGQIGYEVTHEAPAIPMLTNTSLDITYISAEMEFDFVDGSDLQISLVGNPDGVTVDGKLITATKKGVYEAKLSDGSYERTVYIIVKKQGEDYWYIYDENFMFGNYNARNYNEIPIPDGWKSQYAQNTTSTTLGDYTHVGVYPGGISSGIVPFYDTYLLTDGSANIPAQQGAVFTLSDPIVNKFSDYTISMDSMIYGHWPDYAWAGIGLFGRAPIGDSGKVSNTPNNTDRFTFFAVNNSYKSGGVAGTNSGDVWRMTLGDGFYNQNAAVLGKATNINKAIANTGTLVSLPMSLKYEGKTATYTVGDNSSFTTDLSSVGDDNYTQSGAVGVAGYRTGDGAKYLENMIAIKRFSVKLNNDKNTLPAYRIDKLEAAGAYNYEAVEGQGTVDYLVEESSPAIPMNVGTSIDVKYLDFEVSGKKVDGNGAIVMLKDPTTKGIEITEELITAKEPGVYPAFAEVGGNFIDVYIVVKHQKDDTWYLYHEDFTDYATTDKFNKLKIPENWKSQYGHDMYVTELHDMPYLAPLSYTSNVKTGIIPMYDSKKAGHEFDSWTAFYSLNDAVVNAFSDYTITSKSYVYANNPEFARTGIGLYGRADLNVEGKFVNQGNAAGFTTFSINPAIKSDGNGDEYSGKVFTGVYASGGWLQTPYGYFDERAEGINYSRSGSNVGVKMTMSLKYEDKYATFNVGDSSFKQDLTSIKHPDGTLADKNYLNKGAVGVTVHSASSGGGFGTWTAIQYFSVALNNSVEGNYKAANLNCPAYIIDFVDNETTPKDKWNVGEGEEVKIVSTVTDENKRHDPPERLQFDEDEGNGSVQDTIKRIIRRGSSQEILFILLIGGVGLFILLGLGVAAIIVVNSVTKVRRY